MSLLPLRAGAQNIVAKISDKAARERNFAQTLWFNSNNAAGMALKPLDKYNNLSLNYLYNEGLFKFMQEGERESNVAFKTDGALKLGKIALWGDFSFHNIAVDSTLYHTINYDPREDDMPYYVADPNKSYWRKQAYDMEMKVATPFFWDRLSLGAHLVYSTKLSAKQIDPRSEGYKYFIIVKPSALYKIGRHSIGVSALYKNMFERIVLVNSDTQTNQRVFVLKGLGNFSSGIVGGNGGINPFYYKCNRYGGALQYGFSGNMELVTDLGAEFQLNNVFQQPTNPQRMGSTSQIYIFGHFQTLFGKDKANKLELDIFHRSTDGTEYVSRWDNIVNGWVITNSDVRSNYTLQMATLGYNRFIGTAPSYKWRLGGNAVFSNRSDEYFIPNSTLTAMNIYGELFAKKNFEIKHSNILLGVKGGYNYNLSGEYKYRGTCSDAATVTHWYKNDVIIMTSDFAKVGCDIDFSLRINKKTSLLIGGTLEWLLPLGVKGKERLISNLSLGMIF